MSIAALTAITSLLTSSLQSDWVITVYRRAQELLAREASWINGPSGPEGEHARQADGTWCHEHDQRAQSFTTWGALMRAFLEALPPSAPLDVRKTLRQAVTVPYVRAVTQASLELGRVHPIRDRDDAPPFTHAQVLGLFDRAAEVARSLPPVEVGPVT